MPPETAPPDLTIACYVRPALVLDPVDAKIETLRTCEREDRIDALLLRSWPGEVALVEETPHPEVLEQFERFEAWADRAGVSISPPFQIRETTSVATDRTVERLVTPSIGIACYDGDRLVGVFPHTDEETTHTVPEAIAALRTGSLPGPLRSVVTTEAPTVAPVSDGGRSGSAPKTSIQRTGGTQSAPPSRASVAKELCPDCGARPINVQGMLDCLACEWHAEIRDSSPLVH